MFHSKKRLGLLLLMLMLSGVSRSFAFTLGGPFPFNGADAFQVPNVGYQLTGANNDRVDVVVPKAIGEGYRWNTHSIYYAFDQSFVTYFGTTGMAEVDKAFAVLNALTNASDIDLSKWPIKTTGINYKAQALGLIDVKSEALALVLEQLGLAQAERYVWALHERILPPGAQCPNYNYAVVQRNIDPISLQYSDYVNQKLYGYYVFELCPFNPNPLPGVGAETVPYKVSGPSDATFTAVASDANNNLYLGGYYTGLTRDDVGGLKYLYSKNHLQRETVETNSLQLSTNLSSQVLVTSDYATFLAQSLTNSDGALLALYPGLIILSTSNYFGLQVTTNTFLYFTNFPWSPVGTIASLATQTFFTTNIVPLFARTFGNVIVNPTVASPGGTPPFTKGYVTTITTTVGPASFGPPGLLVTNTSVSTVLVNNFPNGEFYILPATNCAPHILLNQPPFPFVTVTPNAVTNIAVIPIGITNINNQSVTQTVITYTTNHAYIYNPVLCIPAPVSVREGIERLTFFRQDFDSLLGTSWIPVTNYYTINSVSNNVPVSDVYRRIILQPDIVFSAQDLIVPGPAQAIVPAALRPSPRFNTSVATPTGLAGPGTIEPPQTGAAPISLVFNKGVPAYIGNFILDDGSATATFQWGSYDGTTNSPVVYPLGAADLGNLLSQVFLQILTSGRLTNGNVGVAYSVQLQATGPTQPSPAYTWSIDPVRPLPSWLTLSSAGLLSGTPPPGSAGFYDFGIIVSGGGRTTKKSFEVEIDP